jgi:Domain of unknown function (DUF4960)
MNKPVRFLSMLAIVAGMAFIESCGSDDAPLPIAEITSFNLTAPEARTGIIDATAKTVSFQPLTPRTAINAVVVDIVVPAGITVTPADGSTVDFSTGPKTFEVSNGTVKVNFTVTVTVEFAASIAFVGEPNAAGSITEVDTKAAYDYLAAEYGDEMEYIPFSSISASSLQYIDVVFYYTDASPGVEPGILEIVPAAGKVGTVVSAFKAWHAAGGKFVLAGMGTQYLNQLDRIPADGTKAFQDNGWAPRIYGSGAGGDNPDQWGVNAWMNPLPLQTVSTTNWDRRTHAIYAGMSESNLANPGTGGTYNNAIYTLVGQGPKEDHNSMWDINAAPISVFADAFDKADKWETAMNATLLGTWGHVVDLCCGAVVEFKPRTTGEGEIIAIGAAAYDFNQSAGANPFLENMKKLTKNSIEYLKTK